MGQIFRPVINPASLGKGTLDPPDIALFRLHASHVNITKDATQQVVEIMSDASGKQTYGFKLLGVLQGKIGFLLVRNISKNQHHADYLTLSVVNGRAAISNGHFPAVTADERRMVG